MWSRRSWRNTSGAVLARRVAGTHVKPKEAQRAPKGRWVHGHVLGMRRPPGGRVLPDSVQLRGQGQQHMVGSPGGGAGLRTVHGDDLELPALELEGLRGGG